jgi:LmbE family N-acetylglucosaminyl deacetylase
MAKGFGTLVEITFRAGRPTIQPGRIEPGLALRLSVGLSVFKVEQRRTGSMNLRNLTADVYIPDALPEAEALRRITHLGIGAHQDDLEFMAFHGIVECFGREDRCFGGVTCTNGSGSARTGPYATYTDAQMMSVRREEQRKAASIGDYGVMIQLDYPSSAVKRPPADEGLITDLKEVIQATQPEIVYTHNLADKHDTHVGVVLAALQAMRALPREQRPKRVIGCEVWRDLDWLPDSQKVVMNVSRHEMLAKALNEVFATQIAGGKQYDLAIYGRRAANATFFESHVADQATQLIFGMDLTPLVAAESVDMVAYVCGLIDNFKEDVRGKLAERLGQA